VTLVMALPAAAGAAGAHTARATSRPTPTAGQSSALVLEYQTPWVVPGQPFDLKLVTGVPSVPTSQLGLTVSVYACLSSVSGFDQSLATSPSSSAALSSTPSPIPVDGLPVASNGVVDLSMPVVVGTGKAPGSPPFTIDLPPSPSQCGAYPEGGVFPIRVQLVNTATNQVLGGFTTHLVYTDPAPGTQRLRVAVVLPLRAAIGPATAPDAHQLLSKPSAALDPPDPAAVAGVTGTVAQIAKYPKVPLTLEASPQTVAALDGSDATRTTVAQLAELAATPSVYQFANATYTPVNATGLVTAGLTSELGLQVARGVALLSSLVTHTPAPQVGGGTGDLGPWITTDGLDTGTLTQLQAEGYSQVVVSSGSVASPPSDGSTTEPFAVASGHGTPLVAFASSNDLASRFVGEPGDPVLAAHQLVAELAQIYYEKPNDIDPRATAVVAPASWSDDPAFVEALLDALTSNPIIEAVTTSQLFTEVPTVATCRGGCRLTGAPTTAGLPVTAIRDQRGRVDGFSSAAGGATARSLTNQLGDLVLASESESLRPTQQTGVLDNTGLALDAQLHQLSVGGDRTVTLTSQQGTLQVTVVSTAPYPVTASLTLTSDKLLFANGTTEWSQLTTLLPAVSGTAHTNVVPVAVRARAPGVFSVDIVMHSPQYRLELASGQVSVRSTATSVVGIVLSVGALAVLAVWWFRTSLRRRRQRRIEGADPAGPAPAP
jgi:hypothetical protein